MENYGFMSDEKRRKYSNLKSKTNQNPIFILHSWFSEAMEILVIKIPIDNHWIMNFPCEKCLRRIFGVGVVSTSSEDNSHPSLLPNSWNSNKKSDKEKY